MTFSKLIKLAWRNLWRQKRRTILTLISIAMGGFLAVMMTGMQDYTWVDMIDTSARLGSGHITIQHPEYLDKPTLSRTVTETADKRATVESDKAVAVAVERATGQAMLATASDSFGAFFIAYDPTVESEYTLEWTDGLLEGELFTQPDDRAIILGEVLAENLDAEIGDKVVYTLTDRNGEIVSGMERLSGIITTGSSATDAGIVLMPIDNVRDVVGYDPAESTQVAIFLNNGRRTLTVSERIDALIGPEAAVLTWDQMTPEIKSFIAMKKGGGLVMNLVIGILIAAGIFNTIFMSVMERTREFGVMMAVGYSPKQLFSLVMIESGFLAIMGLVASIAITAPLYFKLSETGLDMTATYRDMGVLDSHGSMDLAGVGLDPVLPFGLFPESAIAIVLAIVGATLLAGVYPAWKAGRIDPIESINIV
ncbi:MAG: ABC transporter permease, partial [Deltaproteobacteria bacterium]|nr:ABC transporter permease [Deltaproteobacteria bacterium]